MTPSKSCPQGGRRQGGGYEGNRASEVSHLPLNRSRTPSAGGGRGQLWKITPLWSPVFGDGSWSADGSGCSLEKTEREREGRADSSGKIRRLRINVGKVFLLIWFQDSVEHRNVLCKLSKLVAISRLYQQSSPCLKMLATRANTQNWRPGTPDCI